jgi:hypothetical protein
VRRKNLALIAATQTVSRPETFLNSTCVARCIGPLFLPIHGKLTFASTLVLGYDKVQRSSGDICVFGFLSPFSNLHQTRDEQGSTFTATMMYIKFCSSAQFLASSSSSLNIQHQALCVSIHQISTLFSILSTIKLYSTPIQRTPNLT